MSILQPQVPPNPEKPFETPWFQTNGQNPFNVSNEVMTPENLAVFTEIFGSDADIFIGTGNKLLEVYAELGDSDKVLISIDYTPCVVNQILLINFLETTVDPQRTLELFIAYDKRSALSAGEIQEIESVHEDFKNKSIEFVKANTGIIGELRSDQLIDLISAPGETLAGMDFPDYLGKLSRDTGRSIVGEKLQNFSYIASSNRRAVILDGFKKGNIMFLPIDLSVSGAVNVLRRILERAQSQHIALYFSNTLEVLNEFDGNKDFSPHEFLDLPHTHSNIVSMATSTGAAKTRSQAVLQKNALRIIETTAGDQGFIVEISKF